MRGVWSADGVILTGKPTYSRGNKLRIWAKFCSREAALYRNFYKEKKVCDLEEILMLV
jgi:hypothetical protein